MNIITTWLKILTIFIISISFSTTVYAVDIILDNNITKINGDNNLSTCNTGDTYRLGTASTYNGQAFDLLVAITATDNEYPLIYQSFGDCIGVNQGILETRLRDRSAVVGSGSDADKVAYMDLQITVVEQGTSTPLEVDRIVFSAFDLDSSGDVGELLTSTDDIYMITPSRGYIESDGNSNVVYTEGTYGSGYDVKLTGQNTGDCEDNASNPDPACRGGGILVEGPNGINRVSSANIRVSNDNAYGDFSADFAIHRLVQLSFKEVDFNAILQSSTDYGDVPVSYGDAFYTDIDIGTVLGFGFPADDENAQNSVSSDNLGIIPSHFVLLSVV